MVYIVENKKPGRSSLPIRHSKRDISGGTMEPVTVDFSNYQESVPLALDAINVPEKLASQAKVLIKPNLINSSPHPITTSPDCCEVILEYVRQHSKAEIIIAEGCGAAHAETDEIFQNLGYTDLAEKHGVPLVDLNHAPVVSVKNPDCALFPEMHLPKIAFDHFIISVPVLKAHSLATITGTLKNMMGFPPPKYYSGQYGSWKKATFHGQMQQSIIDLNRYISPHLSVMDCSIGMAEFHLGGAHCDPPVGKIIAGYDPWQVDRLAADFLGLDWRNIRHIAAGL